MILSSTLSIYENSDRICQNSYLLVFDQKQITNNKESFARLVTFFAK